MLFYFVHCNSHIDGYRYGSDLLLHDNVTTLLKLKEETSQDIEDVTNTHFNLFQKRHTS